MFITSRWSSLQKRHPHACPKEMWHFAFCTVAPQLGDVKTSRRVSAIGSHLRKRVWRCFECQHSRRSSLEQETDNLRKRKTKEQRRSKETEHIQNTLNTQSSDIHQISTEATTLRGVNGWCTRQCDPALGLIMFPVLAQPWQFQDAHTSS
jgi:hypothetical protein